MSQTTADKITRARATLILDQPFFGALALRLTMTEDASVKTMATDGRHIRYNPMFVDKLSSGLTKAIIAHEVMHCVFDHMGRLHERDPRKWNQATDYVVNQTLEDVGFDFEGTGLLDSAYVGMSADQVYCLLPDTPEGTSDPLDNLESGSSDPAEQAADARDWKVAVAQAANAAKIMGKLPGSLERFVEGMLKPQVNWRDELRRFITERSKDDYSWTRPNKHMLVHGVYIPSLFSETMGDIVIGIDTSGSIDETTLKAFSAECEAIIAEVQPANIHVVYCDAEVAGVDHFARHDEFKLTAKGGGGTAFKPVFDWVEDNNVRPVCLVYLTDLYGQHDFPAPEYPTLWCCTTDQVASFGETLRIEI